MDLGFFDLYEDAYKTTFPDYQDHCGELSRQKMFGTSYMLACPKAEVTYAHAITAKKMALACINKNSESVKEEMLLILTVEFLGLRTRFWEDLTDQRCIQDRETITKALSDEPYSCGIPAKLRNDASIMADCVFVEGYPEVRQMVWMMRALAVRSG